MNIKRRIKAYQKIKNGNDSQILAIEKYIHELEKLAGVTNVIDSTGDSYLAIQGRSEKPNSNIERVANLICARFGVSIFELRSSSRKREIVFARRGLYYWAKLQNKKTIMGAAYKYLNQNRTSHYSVNTTKYQISDMDKSFIACL